MAIRNMTPRRILKALANINPLHCQIAKNEVTVQVMDGDRVDWDATEKMANEVQAALGENWLWMSNGSLVRLDFDPSGELSRARASNAMDQFGQAYAAE